MNPYPFPSAASAVAPETRPASQLSEARLAANKANAQLSTGPASSPGKAKSSLNARDEAAVLSEPKTQIVTALTGRTILLSSDDAAAYEAHLREYTKDLNPVGQRESDLVQSIVDSSWRLQRIPALEAAIYAKGRIQFASQFDDQPIELRSPLIELETHLAYEKPLRNLHIQESRLHRRREKDLAELRELQKARKQRQNDAFEAASRLHMIAKRANQPFHLAELGFEFSMDDLQAYIDADPVSQMIRAANKKAAERAKITQSAA